MIWSAEEDVSAAGSTEAVVVAFPSFDFQAPERVGKEAISIVRAGSTYGVCVGKRVKAAHLPTGAPFEEGNCYHIFGGYRRSVCHGKCYTVE